MVNPTLLPLYNQSITMENLSHLVLDLVANLSNRDKDPMVVSYHLALITLLDLMDGQLKNSRHSVGQRQKWMRDPSKNP
jgi:hypothetical protein